MAHILLKTNEKIENLEMDAFYSFLSNAPINIDAIISCPENLLVCDNDSTYELLYAIVDQYEEIRTDLYRLTIRERNYDDHIRDMVDSKFDYLSLMLGVDLDETEATPMLLSDKIGTHSKKYQTLLRYFKTGLWNESKMRLAVDKGWITMLEFEQITGLKY